jgi:SAM-dependent methyltransferase
MEMVVSIAEKHYDSEYFNYQFSGGRIAARVNSRFFRPFVGPEDVVLDFGCGGGFLLEELDVARRIGVDINEHALKVARSKGIVTYNTLSEVKESDVDVVISSHALEHVENPYEVFQSLYMKLKRGGLLVVMVPCDKAHYPYKSKDRDFHLFSWSANNIGNLAKCVGLEVISAKILQHALPPRAELIQRIFGWGGLNFACILRGRLPIWRTNVLLVARKPD